MSDVLLMIPGKYVVGISKGKVYNPRAPHSKDRKIYNSSWFLFFLTPLSELIISNFFF